MLRRFYVRVFYLRMVNFYIGGYVKVCGGRLLFVGFVVIGNYGFE